MKKHLSVENVFGQFWDTVFFIDTLVFNPNHAKDHGKGPERGHPNIVEVVHQTELWVRFPT